MAAGRHRTPTATRGAARPLQLLSPVQPLSPLLRVSVLHHGAALQREPALCSHLSLCGGLSVAGSLPAFIQHSESKDGPATSASSVPPVSLSRG